MPTCDAVDKIFWFGMGTLASLAACAVLAGGLAIYTWRRYAAFAALPRAPFTCADCGRQFGTAPGEIVTHLNGRPHLCPACTLVLKDIVEGSA